MYYLPSGDFLSSTTELVPLLPFCPERTIFRGGTFGSEDDADVRVVVDADVTDEETNKEGFVLALAAAFCFASTSSSSE